MTTLARKVIILEDDEDIAALFSQLLTSYGAIPSLCRNEAEVLEASQGPNIALALLDIMVPGTDGRSVLTALRDMKVPFPVYFMTGLRESSIGQSHLDLADGILKKPFSITELRTILDEVLSSTETQDQSGDRSRRQVLQVMASVASEQENLRRQRAQVLGLLGSLEGGSPPDLGIVSEQLREFCMSLESALNRVETRLQEICLLLEQSK